MAALLRFISSAATARSSCCNMSTMSGAPWLMLPPTTSKGGGAYNFYNLSDSKVVRFNAGNDDAAVSSDGRRIPIGSSHGWLAVFNKSNHNLFLTDPLSPCRQIKLPSIRTLLSEEYLSEWGCIRKVIVSDDGCGLAMMTFGPTQRLAFCVPGRSTKWTPINGCRGLRRNYHDFFYSTRESTLFCVTEFDEFEAWDLRNPESPQMIMSDDNLRLGELSSSLLKQRCEWQNYVVVADGGEILLVRQYIFTTDVILEGGLVRPDGSCDDALFRADGSFDNECLEDAIRVAQESPMGEMPLPDEFRYKTVDFEVYKYDRKERRVRYLERSLDGLALFVGLNQSSAVAARDYPQLKPDSIYYTDAMNYRGHDIGIFNYQDSTFSSCYYPYAFRSIKNITPSPIWFFPNLAA